MDYKYWINKWQNENIFNIDNDRNKPKSYVFSYFPKANQLGFQNGDYRNIVLADIIARFKRQRGYNVLFPLGVDSLAYSSFLENKRQNQGLTDDISNAFINDYCNLGIGINNSKFIDERHNDFLTLLQMTVAKLYEKHYIKYQNCDVYFDKEHNKIYDTRLKYNYPIVKKDVFTLDISNVLPIMLDIIDKLDTNIKDKLLSNLNNNCKMKINLSLNNGEEILYETYTPQFLGGLSFILANPEYIDLSLYTTYDEMAQIEEYLDGKDDKFGVYSGIDAINPLTGKSIPIYISLMYDETFYFGNPSIDLDDKALAVEAGISFDEILDNGIIVNSDFISNKTIDEANKLIFEEFVSNDIAEKEEEYTTTLLVSSLDTFGALFPFLLDEDSKEIYSLKDYLPFAFSDKLRPIYNKDVNFIGNKIDGTINSSFINGVLPLLSIIFDTFDSNLNIFSDESYQELKEFTSIDFLIIKENDIDSLLYLIALLAIISKEKNINFNSFIKKVIICNDILDENNKEIKKSNNNLIHLSDLFNSHYHDSFRLMVCDVETDKILIYDKEYLNYYDNLIDKIINISNNLGNENNNTDFKLYELKKAITNSLDNYDISNYFKLVKEFINNLDKPLSERQFKELLVLLYPLMPFLSEDLYKKIFKSKYCLINVDWPL